MNNNLFKINVSVIIKNYNTFLLIKRDKNDTIFPGYWGIPGGTVELEDKDLEGALQRECREEVGIEITNLKLIMNNIVKKEGKAIIYLVFSGEQKSGEPKALNEISKVSWKTYDEASKLLLTPYTVDILKTLS